MRHPGALCLLLATTSSCFPAPVAPQRATVAVVDGIPIFRDEFLRAFARVRIDKGAGLPPLASQSVHRQAVLNDMIDRRLLLRAAEHTNIFVGTDEVEAAYEHLRSGWAQEPFAEALARRDMTPMELKAALREKLLIGRYLREQVFSRVAVSDREVATYLRTAPASIEPERVRARQITVKTAEEAQQIRREIRAGLPFADAALKYSLTPEGASGGDLGFFSRGMLPQPLEETCFALKVGHVSDVVASPYGYHLLEVIERRAAIAITPEAQRQAAEEHLRHEKERDAHLQHIKALRAAATIVLTEAPHDHS